MYLEEVINKNLIELNLKAKDRKSAIIELADLLEKEGCLESKELFLKSVFYREEISSTYCGFDIAIPHGITPVVKKPSVCFGRTKGFDWDGDGAFVKIIFLIAVPQCEEGNTQQNDHLKILSSIAKLSLEDEIRELWLTAKEPEEILNSMNNSLAKYS